MSLVTNLETRIAGWLKPMPHLPAGGQKWLGSNVWWVVLISVILSGISFLVGIFGLLALIALQTTASNYYVAYGAETYNGGMAIVAIVVSMLYYVLIAILLATAISPLKARNKLGWNRLFLVFLLNIAYMVLNAVLTFNPFSFFFSLVFGAIFAAIGAYFLFEIRGQFVEHKSTKAASKK